MRGYVAAIILVLVTLGALAGLLSQLNAVGVERPVDESTGSGLLLNDVREAILAWSAAHPDSPGGLPCPDLNNDGFAEAACDTEALRFGLLPWRTLRVYGRPGPGNVPGPPTADGELLWYAVAPALRIQATYPAAVAPCPLHATGAAFAINPDSHVPIANCADRQMLALWRPAPSGALVAGDVAAVVIAPGVPLNAQTRPLGSVDLANPARYFEGRNGATRNAVATPARAGENTFDVPDFAPQLGAAGTNDRIAVIRSGELLDVVEPAIEQRLRSTAFWDEVRRFNFSGGTLGTGFSFMPFPVAFSNPATDGPTPPQSTASPIAYPFDDYNYPAGTPPAQGLMPVGLPPARLQWVFGSTLASAPPTAPAVAIAASAIQPNRDLTITLINTDASPASFAITLTLPNAARAFLLPIASPTGTAAITLSGITTSLSVIGEFRVLFTATVGTTTAAGAILTIPAAQLNPALSALSPTAVPVGAPTAWFMRNQWYRFVYYAPAPRATPNRASGPWATCPADCLTVTFPVSGASAIAEDVALILTGRALPTQNRVASPSDVASYLDTLENRDGNGTFEYRPQRNVSNDRIAYDPR
jgi:hypothetical protein